MPNHEIIRAWDEGYAIGQRDLRKDLCPVLRGQGRAEFAHPCSPVERGFHDRVRPASSGYAVGAYPTRCDPMRRHRRVTRRALRREVNRVLAELDAANPGLLDRRDRETWTPDALDRLRRVLDAG